MKADILVAELSKLSRSDVVEIFYAALDDREDRDREDGQFVSEKLVIAEVSWSESTPPEIRVACASGHFQTGFPFDLSEVGRCSNCGVELCSAAKHVKCPLCLNPAFLS